MTYTVSFRETPRYTPHGRMHTVYLLLPVRAGEGCVPSERAKKLSENPLVMGSMWGPINMDDDHPVNDVYSLEFDQRDFYNFLLQEMQVGETITLTDRSVHPNPERKYLPDIFSAYRLEYATKKSKSKK